jgi:DNA gyrase subunit A
MDIGKIQEVEITQELSKSYLDYAMSVIVARALPDIRDGLKPVHRRILYAMHLMGLAPGGAHSKSAKVVGEVLGKYHPHSDTAVYDAIVRLAQDFTMRYPLVHGQGNFGSVDGDPAAAMRYTEVKLASIATNILLDIEKDTVDMLDNFDATLKEPVYLPALLPNLLLMGSEGIAVGMATKIPTHNLNEVVKAIIATIKAGKPVFEKEEQEEETQFYIKKINLIAAGEKQALSQSELSTVKASFESDITIEELVKYIPGPDFPTGGAIYDANSLLDVYSTGRGKIVVRGIAEIKEGKKGKSIIEISELPYQVNKAQFVAHIAELVHDKKISGIANLRDESDKDGMSVVIELKRDARPKSVLNNLFKHTRLQTTFPANFVALVEGTPYTVNLKQILVEYIKHRQKVITRRTIFELTAATRRAHILEGLKIALDHLDEVIKTIRQSRTQDDAKNNLMKKFGLTEVQAVAILDMQLRRLAALEREKIEKEYEEIKKIIDRLTAILKDPQKVLDIIVKEISELNEKHGDGRKTRIYKQKIGEFSEEDLIAKKDCLITVTKTGYVKRVPRDTYRAQRRGGKGVLGMSTKEADEIDHLVSGTTHDTILFFTNKGRVFGTKAWEIPETSRQSKGQALVNIINLDQGETIQSIVPMNGGSAQHLLMVTQKGIVKKTVMSEFVNLRSNGLIAIKLAGDDSLVKVCPTHGSDLVMLFSANGKAIKFPEKNVRSMGRSTSGMRGMRLGPDDEVIAMEVFPEKQIINGDRRKKIFRDILTISTKGIG